VGVITMFSLMAEFGTTHLLKIFEKVEVLLPMENDKIFKKKQKKKKTSKLAILMNLVMIII
jgi:hypothetical protein